MMENAIYVLSMAQKMNPCKKNTQPCNHTDLFAFDVFDLCMDGTREQEIPISGHIRQEKESHFLMFQS